MADEEVEVEKKSKGPLIKMILLVLGLILVLVGDRKSTRLNSSH